MRQLPEASAFNRELATAVAAAAEVGRVISGAMIGPPVPDPEKVLCIGMNYRDHAGEIDAPLPEATVVFAKFRSSLVSPWEPIVLPEVSDQVDYEGELAVVMGRTCRRVTQADALELVSFLSQTMTLVVGDIFCTGTPSGVGAARTPPFLLREGDTVEVEIDGLGPLSNPVTAEPPGTSLPLPSWTSPEAA